MILAADTPQYIPDLGFFVKLGLADHFALADDQQFGVQSPVCRTVIKSASGRQWLTVPVLHQRKQLIHDVKIDRQRRWRQKHLKTLHVNYAFAPYFPYFIDFFETLYQREWHYLIDLNLTIIEYLQGVLRIETVSSRTSTHSLRGNLNQRTIGLCRATGQTTYLATAEIIDILDADAFAVASLKLAHFQWQEIPYRQQFGSHISGLSVLDLLFNEGPEAIWILAKILSKYPYKAGK